MSSFDPIKTTQAAGYLISLHGNSITRLRLLKLLYIADRECLVETLNPITWDKAVAMDNGPVLSATYDLIKGVVESGDWTTHIRAQGSRDIRLVSDAGVDRLSRYEMNKLEEITKRYDDVDDYGLVRLTHKYPEWINNEPPEGSSKPISFDDRMSGIGFGEDEKRRLLEKHAEDVAIAKMLSGACT